jgi:hypothetical protein
MIKIAEKKTNNHRLNGNGLNSKSHFSRSGLDLGTKNFKHIVPQNLDISTNFNFVISIQNEQNDTSACLVFNHLSAPPVTVLFGCTVPHLSLSSDVYTSHVIFNLLAISLNIQHSTP